MNRTDIRAAVLDEISSIAPDIEIDSIDEHASLREEYDLDSMDALNLLLALHTRLGVNIPDSDAVRLHSVADLVDYIEKRFRQPTD